MDLPTPPGYDSLVPFDRDRHRALRVRRRRPHAFAERLNAIPLVAAEFAQAARHYPIAFGKDATTGAYLPLAVVGTQKEENLFIGEDGAWDPSTYVPSYVRRWPFFTLNLKGSESGLMVAVDEAGLEEGEPALVDSSGNDSEEWRKLERFISEMESARRQTDALVRELTQQELLEPFEAHGFPERGNTRQFHLQGMYRINENRLNALEAKTIKRFMKRGQLSRMYAHLMSLDNFRFLLDRANPVQTDEKQTITH